jgi:5-methylcytosine-specific restriction endonuclease McrA
MTKPFVRSRRQNGKLCTYCARPMSTDVPLLYPTRDHVEPRSKGGRILVWACATCNHVKRDMTEEQWAVYRFEHDYWWRPGRRRVPTNWRPHHHRENAGCPKSFAAEESK